MAFAIRGDLGGRRVLRPARATRRAGNAGHGSSDAPSISGLSEGSQGVSVLAGTLGTWVGLILITGGAPHVSVSSRSPDGSIVADVYKTHWALHFQVR